MLFVKKSNFFSNVFLGTSSQKRSFLDILSGKALFLDQKRELLKKSKKLKSMLFVKILNFFSCVFFMCIFCVNQARKDRFWIFQIQKNDFWAVNRTFKKFLKIEIFQRDQKKTTFIKIQNIEFFAKGLVHTFFQKIQLFLNRDFWANQVRENHFLTFWIE